MHGRPRKSAKPEDEAASAAKATKLRALQSQFLKFHHSKDYSKEAIEVSTKLLEINPESYTAWNYRKMAVENKLSEQGSDPKAILDEELRVVENSLRQNFKSYGAWHHRKWVLSKGHSSVDYELKLLDRFQKADSRNFHAWSYRRFIAALMNRSEEEELKYTTDMIETNFSNYSAWHNRSVLLSKLLAKKVDGYISKEKVLTEEYELVHQAIFTDPDDQSGWFYHLWLIDQTTKEFAPLLLSSWPAHDSNFSLSRERSHDKAYFSFHNHILNSRTLPLVLYFSQAVKGVSSSTVCVDAVNISNDDLIWEPLPHTGSKSSQVWVTHLNISDLELQLSKPSVVEVRVGDSEGIASSCGSHCCQTSRFLFTVSLQQDEENPDDRKDEEMLLWRNEMFHLCDTHSQKLDFANCNYTSLQNKASSTLKWQKETITNEITLFRELLSEINCKIGKLTLAKLLAAHDALLSPSGINESHFKEAVELYNELMTLDPPHHRYYKDEHSLIVLQQVTSSFESLLGHCFHYKGQLSSSKISDHICVRLNNKALSRLGSFDKLLWVQMLDLSYNELQSIEGLEALQLLCFLNLHNNKITSFTALQPLRQLKSLKVLDISHNEIGSHSIDTRRYLCSSPLSHSEDFDWKQAADVDKRNKWEAYLLFRSLNLTQLNIVGNIVADENFKSFLVKVVPTLRWLDGRALH